MNRAAADACLRTLFGSEIEADPRRPQGLMCPRGTPFPRAEETG